jgi:hypothetical protein
MPAKAVSTVVARGFLPAAAALADDGVGGIAGLDMVAAVSLAIKIAQRRWKMGMTSVGLAPCATNEARNF